MQVNEWKSKNFRNLWIFRLFGRLVKHQNVFKIWFEKGFTKKCVQKRSFWEIWVINWVYWKMGYKPWNITHGVRGESGSGFEIPEKIPTEKSRTNPECNIAGKIPKKFRVKILKIPKSWRSEFIFSGQHQKKLLHPKKR